MTKPKVTVLLPAYNAGRALTDAVTSILSQSYDDFELLLIDDGSTDNSVTELTQRISSPNLRVLTHENIGLAPTLNRGLRRARGKFIARMDADDIAHPERLGRQVAHLEANPRVVLVGGQVRRVSNNVILSTSHFPRDHDSIIEGLLNRAHVLSHPAVMFRADAALDVDGYWNCGVSEDWDFFLKLSQVGRLENLGDVVLDYRYDELGINATSMRKVRANIRLAVENHRRRCAKLPELSPEEYGQQVDWLNRLTLQAEIMSLQEYRKYVAGMAGGDRARALGHLALSATLWPRQAVRRVASRTR